MALRRAALTTTPRLLKLLRPATMSNLATKRPLSTWIQSEAERDLQGFAPVKLPVKAEQQEPVNATNAEDTLTLNANAPRQEQPVGTSRSAFLTWGHLMKDIQPKAPWVQSGPLDEALLNELPIGRRP